jgi:hypothetical protein
MKHSSTIADWIWPKPRLKIEKIEKIDQENIQATR